MKPPPRRQIQPELPFPPEAVFPPPRPKKHRLPRRVRITLAALALFGLVAGGIALFRTCRPSPPPVEETEAPPEPKTPPWTTVEETVETVRDTLEVMMPGGGYAFSPTHMFQDNSPTVNVVALYEAVHRFGRYR